MSNSSQTPQTVKWEIKVRKCIKYIDVHGNKNIEQCHDVVAPAMFNHKEY